MKIDSSVLYTVFVACGVVGLTFASVAVCRVCDKEKNNGRGNGDEFMQNDIGDTVLVLGAGVHNSNYAVPNMCFTGVTKDGREIFWDERFDKKNIVNAGDTVVIDLEKRRIIENITQNRIKNNFVRQK